MPRRKQNGACYTIPPTDDPDMTGDIFVNRCYLVRSNFSRFHEVKFVKGCYCKIFRSPPDATLPNGLISMRVYYKLLVDRLGMKNLSPILARRAKAVLKMDPNYDNLEDDIKGVALLLDAGPETESREGENEMMPYSGQEQAAEVAATSENENRGGHNRVKWFDHPATDVCRWFGAMGYKTKDCIEAAIKMKIPIRKSTIQNQVPAGRRGDRGEPAQLTGAQRYEIDLVLGRTVESTPPPGSKGKTIVDPMPLVKKSSDRKPAIKPKPKPKTAVKAKGKTSKVSPPTYKKPPSKAQVKPKPIKKPVKAKPKPPVKKVSKPKSKPKGKK